MFLFCWIFAGLRPKRQMNPKSVYPKHERKRISETTVQRAQIFYDSCSAEARLEKINKDLQALAKEGKLRN